VSQRKIVAKRHSSGGETDQIPMALPQDLFEGNFRRSAAAVRVEHAREDRPLLKHSGESPDTKRWREKRVLAARRIVWTNQEDGGSAHGGLSRCRQPSKRRDVRMINGCSQ
jgi:hypothetical protein